VEVITRSQLKEIERYADALFQEHGIDIEFQDLYKGTHFFDRINDPRNQSPISLTDLKLLFAKVSMKYGDELGMESPGSEGVLKDMRTNVNMPFILKWDSRNRELDLIPKTIMKKKNFVSKGNEYRVENRSMKLVEIYRDIKKLNEIGDSASSPAGANYVLHFEGTSHARFEFSGLEYIVEIIVVMRQDNNIAISVDFWTSGELGYGMTNQHKALELMSYIVGCITTWISKYHDRFFKNEELLVHYIKFNPKKEEKDVAGEFQNRRDRLYRMYIEKFAKKYGSSVSFIAQGGVTAKFNPPLTIK
jgi:hypothetical protein